MEQAHIQDTCWTPSVYPPSDDSFALVDAFQHQLSVHSPPRLCLEVGCGSGFVCTSVALTLKARRHNAFVLATDTNPEAAECTRKTAKAHGVASCVDVVVTSFWDPIRTRHVDWILFNPPYVPTPQDELLLTGIHAAWAGGQRGRHIIDQFLNRLPEMLHSKEKKHVFLVTIEQNAPYEIQTQMQNKGYPTDIVLKRRADQELLFVLRMRESE